METMAPNPKRIALKEWAVVGKALGQGRQVILLRKGGIKEEEGEFRLRHGEFFLFPTFEHQHRDYLRPEFVPYFQASVAEQSVSGEEIVFSCLATVNGIEVVSDLDKLRRLSAYHIWNDTYVEMRYRYKPETPLYLLLVRAYRMQPVRIEARPAYRGCKSWVELDSEVEARGIEEVLSDEEFDRKCLEIRALLA